MVGGVGSGTAAISGVKYSLGSDWQSFALGNQTWSFQDDGVSPPATLLQTNAAPAGPPIGNTQFFLGLDGVKLRALMLNDAPEVRAPPVYSTSTPVNLIVLVETRGKSGAIRAPRRVCAVYKSSDSAQLIYTRTYIWFTIACAGWSVQTRVSGRAVHKPGMLAMARQCNEWGRATPKTRATWRGRGSGLVQTRPRP